VAALLLLDRLIVAPLESAALLRVTVPVVLVPPVTVEGFIVSDVSVGAPTGASTDNCASVTELDGLACSVTSISAETCCVPMLKLARSAPEGTVTLAGSVATALSLDSDTTKPLGGARPSSTSVASEDSPPVTIKGSRKNDITPVALGVAVTSKEVVSRCVPTCALIVTVVFVAIAKVDTTNDTQSPPCVRAA